MAESGSDGVPEPDKKKEGKGEQEGKEEKEKVPRTEQHSTKSNKKVGLVFPL